MLYLIIISGQIFLTPYYLLKCSTHGTGIIFNVLNDYVKVVVLFNDTI